MRSASSRAGGAAGRGALLTSTPGSFGKALKIIAVDRFYEQFHKHGKKVSLADLIILWTAKYLVDFNDIPRRQLHIVTTNSNLWSGTKQIQELPSAYDPTKASDSHDRVFP